MCHVHDLEGLSLIWETLARAGQSSSISLQIMISINCALRCKHYLLEEILCSLVLQEQMFYSLLFGFLSFFLSI